jgi:hypothetical protein
MSNIFGSERIAKTYRIVPTKSGITWLVRWRVQLGIHILTFMAAGGIAKSAE